MTAFFDSNVLLYSAGSDVDKAERSDALLAGGGWISVQVLNEIASVSQRKMQHGWARTRALLDAVTQLVEVVDLTQAIHRRGLAVAERFRLSVYDGLIVAAALETGCDLLYSEDMHHGLVVDGRLRIENPFLA
jgi:predicted nucleic acid-binding protein